MNRLVYFTRRIFILFGIDVFFSWLSSRIDLGTVFFRMMPPPSMYPIPCFRSVVRNGIRLRLDLSQFIDWTSYFCLDPEHKRFVYPHIKDGMTVLDIGSNMGEMAMNFALKAGSSGMVVGFEPVPENYQRCAYNFKLNEFNHLLVEHVAVGRCTGTLYFDSMPLHNSGGAVMSSTSSSQSVAVQMTSIDEYVRLHAFAKVDFIKIDVEGYEMEVLIGAEHVLRMFHPVLCIEVNDEHLRRFGSSEAELLGFLRDHRYSIHVLTPKVLSKSGAWHFDILAEPTVSELEGDLTTQGDGR